MFARELWAELQQERVGVEYGPHPGGGRWIDVNAIEWFDLWLQQEAAKQVAPAAAARADRATGEHFGVAQGALAEAAAGLHRVAAGEALQAPGIVTVSSVRVVGVTGESLRCVSSGVFRFKGDAR